MSCWRIREAFRGEWLKASRKKLLAHGLVLTAFVLYCVFLAPPLFDRLQVPEGTEGESNLYDISLPAVTDDIECGVDLINADNSEAVLSGWAFIEGQDMVGSQIFLVLSTGTDTYVFDTVPWSKPMYVMEHFGDLDLNLDDSGFFAILPLREVSAGNYTLGVYIRKDNAEALQYTDEVVKKADTAQS
jgi:hypothetical protein